MSADRTIDAIVLSDRAPSEVRRLVADLLEARRAEGIALPPETAQRVALLASELITEAWDHGSEAATVRIDLDDGVVAVEVFDGPRRSAIAMTGREEGVPRLRKTVLSEMADRWSSDDMGDAHLARCEVRYS
jgi:hypothetical protein